MPAMAVLQMGRAEAQKAVADAQQILEREPHNANACCVMGYAALSRSAYEEAARWFTRGMSIAPESAEIHHGLGVVHRCLNRTREAFVCFERAIQLKADYAEAFAEQGVLLAERGEIEDAEDSLNLALTFKPDLYTACLGYGKLLRADGRLQKALVYLQRSVNLLPTSSVAWFELALALNNVGETAPAVAAYEKAIELEPTNSVAYVNLGLVYLAQFGDAVRAEQLFSQAAQISPDMLEAQVNLGLALHEQGRSFEALRYYDQLVEAHPACAEFRWHRATIRLALEKYDLGWDDYEARKLRGERWWRQPPSFREWDGTPLRNQAIFVYPEQGIGDEIMFASCLPDMFSTARKCVVECDARLAQLFERSFPEAVVHGARRDADRVWLRRYPELDVQCAIGSLPRFFRRSSESFANRTAYLKPDPIKVERWRKALQSQRGELKIGIAWRAGTLKTRKEQRSTDLADWAPILRQDRFGFVSLQPGGSEELREFSASYRARIMETDVIHDDVDELAAMISALDLVITVQGTIVHISGALGLPVWVLLSRSCEWRYLQAGTRMPWYPSARLYRQRAQKEWQPVFQEVADALSAFHVQRLVR
jgi:tetratricopeptide (TPR) repeat protein